jgi:hypothetical protein
MKTGLEDTSEKRTNPLSWGAKAVIGVVAVLLGFFSHDLAGWGVPAGVASAAIVIPILMKRRYWRETWFWMTMLAMSVLQIPLIILARPLMDQMKFAFNIVFGTADVFVVAAALNFVCPYRSSDS